MFGPKKCVKCKSSDIYIKKKYLTKRHGERNLYRCKNCKEEFSETKGTFLENIKKPIKFVIQVLKARSEGLGLNAAARTFKVSSNTIVEWEKRFSPLKEALFLYSLLSTFIKQEIEGDELYTKIYRNVPPDQSKGWTIVLMERSSRFIWEMKCGPKNEKLFKSTLEKLLKIIERTEDFSLLTDGERRYGNTLFELCKEQIYSGKPGRPKTTLPKGVRVRIKNKGSQKKSPGRKKKKYVAPKAEHPETIQNLKDNEIHANHNEAHNASLRRKNSAYRRKTNTYAKTTQDLQRTLDLRWVVHNFIDEHFTTKVVPAVALGIISVGMSWTEILSTSILAG